MPNFSLGGCYSTAIFKKIAAADLVLATVFVHLAELTRKLRWLNSVTNPQRSYPASFLLRDLDSAPFVMEHLLRPCVQFERKNSTVFIRDSDLGWKYRPDAAGFS